jgi:peroxiredoxin
MNTISVGLALASFMVVFGFVFRYLRTIPRGKVPVSVTPFVLQLGTGLVMGLAALYFAVTGDGNVGFVWLPLVLALLMSSFLLWVLSQREIPLGDIKVVVGDKLLPFNAIGSDGQPFSSEQLVDKRTLFKFYRGGWCPYCSAELVAFNSMRGELAEFDVSVVALSKDDPVNATIHRERDSIDIPLLCDPELEVIRQYGVEHHKALGQEVNSSTLIGGIPFGTAPFKLLSMAVPTTLLIDEHGVIRWLDQSDDYRLRASNERVLTAVRDVFD